MKFLIIFIFLAAAASLGLAKKPSYKPSSVQSDSPSLTELATYLSYTPSSVQSDSPSPTYPPESPTDPPELPPTNQPESPTNNTDPSTDKPDSSTDASGLQAFAGLASKGGDLLSALLKLSPQCQAALFTVVANPEFFTCIPVQYLAPLLPVVADKKALEKLLKDPTKLPPLLTPVLDGVCAAPKCSDKGVADAFQAVKAGCKKDAKNPLIVMVTAAITFYSPVRDIACFQSNKKEYCLFDTLQKIFSLPKSPIHITGTKLDDIVFAEPKFICTPCNKAIVNTVFNYLDADKLHSVEFLESAGVPKLLLTIAKLGVGAKCGFQFLDGDVGHPEKTDPDHFEYQLSGQQNLVSGASNLKGISFVTMIGGLLASILMI